MASKRAQKKETKREKKVHQKIQAQNLRNLENPHIKFNLIK